MFSINDQFNLTKQPILDANYFENFDDEFINHLSPSKKIMLKIDKLAREKLDELLEPVRHGEMSLDDLKQSRGLI
ncbi:MAG: hypothetical protein K8R11_13000 [Methanococcoides sp.]|nr:hypothetical protein [Methanococcoides sp.]